MKRFLILCLLPFMACQKEAENNDSPGPQLWPLAVGNYWIYSVKTIGQDGTIGTDTPDTMKVVSTGTKPGYFALDEDKLEQYYSTDTDIKQSVLDQGITEQLILHKSNKIDTFNVFVDSDGYKTVCVSHPEELRILNFPCFMNEMLFYRPDGEFDSKDHYYISPGIGVVRYEYFTTYNNTTDLFVYRQYDLTKYKIDN